MSISQNFPSSRPSLNLNFARSKKLDPRITFTRTSTATYVDEDGLVKIAATDTPRFEHNPSTGESLGLLIEESRTNLVTYSEQIDQWTGIVNVSVSPNVSATTSPNGDLTADKLIETATTGGHNIQQGSISKSANAILTFTVFAKSAERTWMGLTINDDVNGFANRYGAEFDLASGIASEHDPAQGTYTNGSFAITPYPNGWYRCRITCTTSTESLSRVRIFTLQSSAQWTSASSYTGDGTSGIYIWGAQVEAGAFPTSYIPTVASTVTRSADNASITGTNFSGFYNPSEGTIYCNANNISGTGSQSRIFYQFVNSTASSTDFIRQWIWIGNTNLLLNSVYTSGSNVAEPSTTLTSEIKKTSFAYRVNDFAVSYNGSSPSTDTSGNLPSGINQLTIGNNISGTLALSGYISQLLYYPVRLPNAQLQNLTK